MYKQTPTIETAVEALDELADVRMTLSGLASLTLALANSGMYEPEAIRLVSCLLDYCTLTTEAVSYRLDEEPSNTTQPTFPLQPRKTSSGRQTVNITRGA